MEYKQRKFNIIFSNTETKRKQASKENCAVYGYNTVSNAIAKRWFQGFRSGNMDTEHETRSGRPILKNVDKIMEIVESDRHVSTYY